MEPAEWIRALGAKIKAARKGRFIKQAGVAELTGISKDRYWRIENGRTCPSVFELQKIADELRVEYDSLIPDDLVPKAEAS